MKTTDGSELEDMRDKALLTLLFSTGLRISELCSLNDDLDLSADEFSIRGKGGKVRIVFLSDEAKQAVKAYLFAREKSGLNVKSESLFVSASGERMYSRAAQRIIRKRALEAGITKHVTPHTIRHYFATNLLQNGADIRSVQMMLGHASINTTQIYTNLSDKHLKEIHKKFHH
jgi:site-specific recombinase XerD